MSEATKKQLPKVVRDRHGEIRLMAHAGNWVMVRRPGCVPYTMLAKEWAALSAHREPDKGAE